MHLGVTASTCLVLSLFAIPAAAQDEEKPNLSGTWQFDASKSDVRPGKISSATWVIEAGENSIHITQTENGKSKKLESQCTTDGKECKFPGDRRVSFWYNGPVLVEMETKSERAVRYRLKISEDGKTLTVEVTYLVPQIDKIDTLVFQKQG